jgi:hypothetical protein
MDKNLFKNPWVLTGLFVLTSVIMAYIGPALSIFGIRNMSTTTIGVFLGAFFVGYIYSYYFREPISKELKTKVTLMFTAYQIIASVILFVALGIADSIVVLIGIGLPLIYAILIYFIMGFGSKATMDTFKRAEEKAKKK